MSAAMCILIIALAGTSTELSDNADVRRAYLGE